MTPTKEMIAKTLSRFIKNQHISITLGELGELIKEVESLVTEARNDVIEKVREWAGKTHHNRTLDTLLDTLQTARVQEYKICGLCGLELSPSGILEHGSKCHGEEHMPECHKEKRARDRIIQGLKKACLQDTTDYVTQELLEPLREEIRIRKEMCTAADKARDYWIYWMRKYETRWRELREWVKMVNKHSLGKIKGVLLKMDELEGKEAKEWGKIIDNGDYLAAEDIKKSDIVVFDASTGQVRSVFQSEEISPQCPLPSDMRKDGKKHCTRGQCAYWGDETQKCEWEKYGRERPWSEPELKENVELKVVRPDLILCNACGQTFKTKTEAYIHVEDVHCKDRPRLSDTMPFAVGDQPDAHAKIIDAINRIIIYLGTR